MAWREDANKVAEEIRSGNRNYGEGVLGHTAIAGRNLQEAVDPYVSPVEEALVDIGGRASRTTNLMGLLKPVVGDAISSASSVYDDLTQDYPDFRRAVSEVGDTMSLVPAVFGYRGVKDIGGSYRQDPSIKGMLMSEGDMMHPSLYGVSKAANPLDPMSEKLYEMANKEYNQQARTGFKDVNPIDKAILEATGKNIMPSGSKLGKLSLVEGAQRTAKGWADWLTDGAKRAYASFNDPEARALYAEAGITQVAQKQIDLYMAAKSRVDVLKERKANGEDVSKELNAAQKDMNSKANIAIQQMQAGANISTQAGNPIGGKFLDEIAREASDPTVLKIKGTPYFDMKGDWYEDTAWEAIKDSSGRVKLEDIEVIQRHVPWSAKVGKGDDVKVIIKRGSSADTGRHYEDLFQNNVQLTPVAKAFQELPEGQFKFDNMTDMMKALKKQQMVRKGKNAEWQPKFDADGKEIKYDWMNKRSLTPPFKKKKPEQNFSIKYDNPNSPDNSGGIWIQTSKVGSAKVEGAVNQLFRVAPDGHLIGVMSDKHDFLENIHGLKQMFAKELPTDVIAVTLPLEGSIFKSSTVRFKDAPEVATTPRKSTEGSTDRAERAREKLDRASAIFPSPEAIAKQRALIKQAERERALGKLKLGAAATGAGMLSSPEEEQ